MSALAVPSAIPEAGGELEQSTSMISKKKKKKKKKKKNSANMSVLDASSYYEGDTLSQASMMMSRND